MKSDQKRELYDEAFAAILSVLEGEIDPIARMASTASLLTAYFASFSWVGFYRVDPTRQLELVVGPYQGPLGCLRIPFDQGVCGAAARRRETILVEDVHAFEGHIACDAGARSEIVVPVLDARGRLAAVLDVDSHALANFDVVDQEKLEAIAARVLAG